MSFFNERVCYVSVNANGGNDYATARQWTANSAVTQQPLQS